MIDPTTLRAMNEELSAITKEAGIMGALGAVGGKVMSGMGRASRVVGAQKGFGQAVNKGIGLFGGGAQGSQRLRQAVGGATIGAGALAAGAMLRRPQPSGY